MSKNSKIRASKLYFDERIFKQFKWLSNENKCEVIINEVKKFNIYNAKIPLFDLASNIKLPSDFDQIYNSEHKYFYNMMVGSYITKENYIYWILGVFHKNKDLIKKFNLVRKKVNHCVLSGKPQDAIDLIHNINSKCYSWWAIQYELHIIKEFELASTRDYFEEIPNLFFNEKYPASKIDELKLISESSSEKIFIRSFLSRINEYRASGIQSVIERGAIESCRYLSIHDDIKRSISLNNMHSEFYESIIDQYVIFKEILLESEVEMDNEIIKIIKKLSFYVCDDEIINILDDNIEPNDEIKTIINHYTYGNYPEVIEKVEYLQGRSLDNYLGLIEVYSRAMIYSKKQWNEFPANFFVKLSCLLADILTCNNKAISSIEYLERVCLKFKLESWSKSLTFHLKLILEELNDKKILDYLRKHTRILGALNTSKVIEKTPISDFFNQGNEEVPKHRILKYGAEKNISVFKDDFPIISDYIKVKSANLIKNNNLIEAIDFCISQYLTNSVSFLFLPISTLCSMAGGIEKNNNTSFISCLILYDIYNREINDKYEYEKNELFEELMNFNGSHKPSVVFDHDFYNEFDSYFLRYLCIPTQLDSFIQYQSNDDVIHERVAILDLLINAKVTGGNQLKLEKDNVLETLFAEKLRAKLESGKLYVDIQSIKTNRKYIYSKYFESAKEIDGGIFLNELNEDSELYSKDLFRIDDKMVLASSPKMELLYSIYMAIVNDFALNENYGLDKYLSAEIRHIVFTTQLRSCFEKTSLVTIKQNDEYQTNFFWSEKYQYINHNILREVDVLLKRFSSTVDLLLTEVNENFRVETSLQESSYIFNYTPYHHRLVRISEVIGQSKNVDDFLSGILDYMWEITSENAKEAQKIINDYLEQNILNALTTLESGINSVRRNAAMVDLIGEIKNARTLFRNEVELVLNWFRFVGEDDSKNFERLGVVIDATISSFDSVYGHKYIKPYYLPISSDIHLNYRESRALFISLFTALENACKYGSKIVPVVINYQLDNGVTYIKITNELDGVTKEEANEIIKNEKEKWNENYSILNTIEGGSGFYKIYSILSTVSSGLKFDIKTELNNFISIIEVKDECFSNRRQSTKA